VTKRQRNEPHPVAVSDQHQFMVQMGDFLVGVVMFIPVMLLTYVIGKKVLKEVKNKRCPK
jgi:hypothetical protein